MEQTAFDQDLTGVQVTKSHQLLFYPEQPSQHTKVELFSPNTLSAILSEGSAQLIV